MRHTVAAIVAATLLIPMTACERPNAKPLAASSVGKMDPRNLALQQLSSHPESVSLVARFQSLGVPLPPLLSVFRRPGHAFAGFKIASADAIPMWERLRAVTDRSGFYPLVIRDEYGMFSEEQLPCDPPATIVSRADSINTDAWLKSLRDQIGKHDPDDVIPRQPGAKGETQERYTTPFDLATGEPAEGIFIILIPTKVGSEVPAFIGFGGWNACPNPEEHVAIFRHWFAKYGAEPVTCSADVLELRCSRKPMTTDEALQLAEEQFLYCRDIVDQGVGSIDALADTLLKSHIWFFWWD